MDENCMKSCNKCSTGSVTTPPTVATTTTTTTTASPPTTTAGTGTGGGEDPGCYKEGVDRDLPTRAYGDGENTRSRCRKTCLEQNFQYAGVQNGVGCWCGNDFGKHGKVPDAHCHYPCSGNADETCGAWFLNYIMRTATQSSDYVHVTVPGCFTETPSRELYHREYSDGANTRERCTMACRAGGYKYAGVQNGRGCWCGNEAGGYGSLDESECDVPCSGDSDQTCGAEYKNYIMETGYTAPRS